MRQARNGKKQNTEAGFRIEKAMASVHASMAMEGLKPSKRCVALGRQYLEGKIRGQEAIARIKARYGINTGTTGD